jgi:hypothetical protein
VTIVPGSGADNGDVVLDGRYLIGRPLGTQPRTYDAHDDVLGRNVLVTVLGSSTADLECIRIAASLSHTSLTRVLDANLETVAETRFVVTELPLGTSIASTPPQLSDVEVEQVRCQLQQLLTHLHGHGIGHRFPTGATGVHIDRSVSDTAPRVSTLLDGVYLLPPDQLSSARDQARIDDFARLGSLLEDVGVSTSRRRRERRRTAGHHVAQHRATA